MISRIFGQENALLYPYIKLIIKENLEKSYFFMDENEWHKVLDNSINFGNKIFWLELLNRIHYASIVNLLRTKKLLDLATLRTCWGIEKGW